MTEATGKRKIGMGMKPRGAKIESIIPQAASADEGQAEEPVEAVTTDQDQGAGGNRLEAESVQNLDSENSATVADDGPVYGEIERSAWQGDSLGKAVFGFTGFKKMPEVKFTEEGFVDPPQMREPEGQGTIFMEPSPQVPSEAFEELAKIMANSADASGAMMVYDSPQSQHGGMRPATAEERETVNRLTEHTRPPIVKSLEKIEQEIEEFAKQHSLGEQPNGTYKLVVTLEEGYIEPVRQWAESDGVTVEKWVTNLIQTYLESWSQAAKGR